MTKKEFIERLIEAGWSRTEAQKEYERIQAEEDESGYDGP